MKLYKVTVMSDTKEYRGNFIQAAAPTRISYLTSDGRVILINQDVQNAVTELFNDIESLREQVDDLRIPGTIPKLLARVEPPPLPGDSVIGVEVLVSAIERLSKAFR